ncbi:uncharacterized protein LOC117221266 [Megalopta genalis]|uniref:uncharacterized protein LOC117221266 n=1 Tax=Megalopta genalis TaxID=115081 RepID=UPI003FD0DAFA
MQFFSRKHRFSDPPIEISYHQDRDRNLIEDVPFVSEYMIQGELSFGMLTDYEMEEFLLPQAEEQFLNEIRTFPRNQPQEIIEKCRRDTNVASYLRKIWTQQQEIIEKSVAEVNLDNLNGETIDIGDVEGTQFKKPTTSRKRPTESLPETPTKKRKTSTKEAVRDASVDVPSTSTDVPSIVLAPHEKRPVQESVEHPTEPSIVEPIIIQEFPIQQVNINEIELVEQPRGRRRRRKFADNEIALSDGEMRNMISNVKAHTTELWLSSTRTHSVDYYLQQPCSKISHGVLAKKLNELFSKHMITRPVIENELPDMDEEDTVREGMTSKIHERTDEMTSKIDLPITDISEHSKTVEKIQPIQHTMQQTLFEMQIEDSEKQVEVSLPAVPEINGPKYKKVKPIELSEIPPHVEKSITSSLSPKATLTKSELKAFLEIRWRDEANVKFHELISSDSYTKIDVARAFSYCLEFQAEKYAVVKQDIPYGIIWIAKYVNSSESSGETS